MKKFRVQNGFTLIELLVVMGIIGILFGVSTISLLSVRDKTSLNTKTATLINDLKSQQSNAMVGYAQASPSHDSYGIYLQADSYTLFSGDTYSPTDPNNFIITLPGDLQFTGVLFPSSQIVFGAIDGEIAGFVAGSNSITIRNVNDGNTKTIELNRFGVITSIN